MRRKSNYFLLVSCELSCVLRAFDRCHFYLTRNSLACNLSSDSLVDRKRAQHFASSQYTEMHLRSRLYSKFSIAKFFQTSLELRIFWIRCVSKPSTKWLPVFKKGENSKIQFSGTLSLKFSTKLRREISFAFYAFENSMIECFLVLRITRQSAYLWVLNE